MKHLATYLHDHGSGATGALELINSLAKAYRGEKVGSFLTALHAEISWEHQQLEKLCKKHPIGSAIPRKVAGWLAERALEAKLAIDGSGTDAFRLFESLEALSVGIAGKRLLWKALKQQAKNDPKLNDLDYNKLIRMAIRQRRTLEPFRLAAATDAFQNP